MDNSGNKLTLFLEKKNGYVHYACKPCSFTSHDKTNFRRHLSTHKHRQKTMVKKVTNLSSTPKTKRLRPVAKRNHVCVYCNKSYKYVSGLSRHKQKCKMGAEFDEMFRNKNLDDLKKMVLKQQKREEAQEKKIIRLQQEKLERSKAFSKINNELMIKVNDLLESNEKTLQALSTKPIQQVVNNYKINNNNNISVNLFLNKYCKDAMNLKDFIENINLSVEDLDYAKKHGGEKGICDILIRHLTDMKPTERPIHCTDKKRQQFYIKDKNKWDRDDEHLKIDEGIVQIQKKQLDKLHEWSEQNDIWGDPQKSEYYMKMVHEIATTGKELQKRKEKVRRGLCDTIGLKKTIQNFKVDP